jgi:hypothetical protein
VREGVGQPVLIFLRRPPTFAHQHPVYVPSSKHPEDVPSGSVIEPGLKTPCVAQGNNHPFLSLIAQAFSLLLQFCQLGCNHTRTSQQIEGCTLRVMNLPGNGGRQPQSCFGITRAQGFFYRFLVVGSKD